MQIKICQRSAPVWLMSVLQIRRTIPYNARKAVAEVRKIEAGKGVTKREDMEKAFPPVLSDFTFIVVAGNAPVEKCRAQGQQAAAPGAYSFNHQNFVLQSVFHALLPHTGHRTQFISCMVHPFSKLTSLQWAFRLCRSRDKYPRQFQTLPQGN